ncbi:hypothetical protein D3C87_1456230 [compost metagenome]
MRRPGSGPACSDPPGSGLPAARRSSRWRLAASAAAFRSARQGARGCLRRVCDRAWQWPAWRADACSPGLRTRRGSPRPTGRTRRVKRRPHCATTAGHSGRTVCLQAPWRPAAASIAGTCAAPPGCRRRNTRRPAIGRSGQAASHPRSPRARPARRRRRRRRQRANARRRRCRPCPRHRCDRRETRPATPSGPDLSRLRSSRACVRPVRPDVQGCVPAPAARLGNAGPAYACARRAAVPGAGARRRTVFPRMSAASFPLGARAARRRPGP